MDCGGRGHHGEVRAILLGPGAEQTGALASRLPEAEGRELASPWAAPGSGGESTQGRSSESSLFVCGAMGGAGGHLGKSPGYPALIKVEDEMRERWVGAGGVGGKEMIAGETDAIERDSWR